MSVSIHQRQSRKPYEVRWAEPGGRQRSRSFTRRRDAERFDERVLRLKEQGRLLELDAEGKTLADFGVEWWDRAKRDLQAHTRNTYRQQWNKHILPRLGRTPLAQITPRTVEDFRASMEADGIGAPTIRYCMAVLQAALSRAVLWGYLPSNPVAAVRKPGARPVQRRPVPPVQVEHLRSILRSDERYEDAALVCTLAYAGLRPEEALALTWGDTGESTLRIERAVALGEHKLTKTEHARTVRLIGPLAEDLAELRVKQRHPADRRLVWARKGELWPDSTYRSWRRNTYRPFAERAGIEDRRPYTLRASFASLLIAEGHPITYVARQCGHSVETCLRHYALLFEDFAGTPNIDATELIRGARLRGAFADRVGEAS